VKPIFNLAHGMPGASLWKKKLMLILQSRNMSLFYELSHYLLDMELIEENRIMG
jgi:tRNA-dihydrouridine synthase A